jgi:predicted component of type VI protein secretion system
MALKTMLSQEKGFLPIDQAIEESLIDLKIHQSALIYSIRQGLNNTLRHFDPKEIEKQTPQHSGLSAMLTSKKSQYWDEFVKCYHQQNVNEWLRQELVNGYLDFTKRLKKPLRKSR